MPCTALLICDYQDSRRSLVPDNMKETFETALAQTSSLLAFARQRSETIVLIYVVAGVRTLCILSQGGELCCSVMARGRML